MFYPYISSITLLKKVIFRDRTIRTHAITMFQNNENETHRDSIYTVLKSFFSKPNLNVHFLQIFKSDKNELVGEHDVSSPFN